MKRISIFLVAIFAVAIAAEPAEALCGGNGIFGRLRARRAARQESRAQAAMASYSYTPLQYAPMAASGCQCPGCPGNVFANVAPDAPPMTIAPAVMYSRPATFRGGVMDCSSGTCVYRR